MKKIILLFFMSLLSFGAFAQGLPLESFDTPGVFPPTDWEIHDNGIGPAAFWTQATGTGPQPAHTGAHAAYLNRENVATGIPEDWLVTPTFTVPTNPQLRFWSRLTLGGDDGSIYRIMITTNVAAPFDATNYTQIQQWTELEINPSQTTYTEKVVTIPATYVGQPVKLAFVMAADNGDRWLVDDVMVVEQCLDPTNLGAPVVGIDNAQLNWTNTSGATSWEVIVLPAAGIPSMTGVTYNGAPPYIATETVDGTPLTENTDYKFYVRALCDDGGTSELVGPFLFSTVALGETCGAAIQIPSLPYSSSGNTSAYGDDYNGSPGASGCGTTGGFLNGDDVVYSYTATATGLISISLTNNGVDSGVFVYDDCADIGVSCLAGGISAGAANPINIDNFAVTAGQTYYFVISTDGFPQSTSYMITVQQVTCAKPVGLPTTGADNDSANLSWTNPGGATSWEVVVQFAGSGVPAGSGTTVNTTPAYVAGGLNEATNYEYYVRADCGDGTFSAWAGPYAFSTTQVPAAMNYTQGFEGVHGWSLSNGSQTNQWFVGTATANGGTHSLYISNNGGTSNTYTNNVTSVVHAYRDIQMPAAVDQMVLSYDWKALAEGCCDFIRVWIVPASFTPTPGTQITAGTNRIQVGGNHNNSANWQTVNQVINGAAYSGEVLRLVFEWRNDGSVGTAPPGAVDNINLSLITCPSPTNLIISDLQEDEVTFEWDGPTSVSPTFDYYFATTNTAPNDATVPTGNVGAETVNIGSLAPSTGYWFWVRSNCGPGDTSFWVGPVQFTTPQIPADMDFEEDFEGTINWTLNNGTQTNKWVVGTATNNSPTHSLYISNDNGVSNAYTNNVSSTVHAYRDIQMPAAVDQVLLSYDWKALAENCCDFIRVWIVPVTFTPTPGTQITAGGNRLQVGGNHNNSANWQTANHILNGAPYAGQIIRLVFEWRNDGSVGTPPPGAIDNVEFSLITCPSPTNLVISDQQDDEVTYEWDGPTSVSPTYDYYFATTNTAPDDATVPTGNVSAETVTIGDLEPSTGYWFWVRSNCGPDDASFWVGPVQFTTPQIPADLDFEEDFEGTINWTLNNGTQVNKWVVGTATSSSPTTALYISNDNGVTNNYTTNTSSVVHAYRDLAIPAIGAQANLSYDWKAQAESCCDFIRVWLVPVTFSPTPGTMITAGPNRVQIGGNHNNNSNWLTVNQIIDVSAYAGQSMRLVFEWRNDGSVGTPPAGGIDNVALSLITCSQPTALTAYDLGDTVATLEWTETGTADSWEIYLVPAGDPAPTEDTEPTYVADTNPYTVEDLGPGLTYSYYVRAVCGDDDSSFWSGPYTFNTSFCPLEDQCGYEFVMTDTGGNTWNGNTMSVIQNGITIATLTGPAATDGTNPVTQVVPVCPGVPLELHWNDDGFSDEQVGISIINPFDETIFTKAPGEGSAPSTIYEGIPNCEPITCPQPTELMTEGYNYDSVMLSWVPGGTETQWEVVIQTSGGAYPGENPTSVIPVDGDPEYIVSGLNPDILYEYYVRAICAPGDESFWSGPFEFSLFSPPGCAAVDVFDEDLEIIAPNSEISLCPGDEACFDFSANYYQLKETDVYDVEAIAYDPPYPFLGGTELNVTTDDIWSPVVDLPFDFCFFGETFNEAKVGSNGVVQFGENMTDAGFCPWSYNQTVPNAGFPIKNAIYGVYQDINPAVAGSNVSINYQVLGSYPCRALVVNYYDVPQFSCGLSVGTQTTQIVIYEISNIIEVYVESRTPCPGWQGGVGVIGVQNAAGTVGFTPPGRNTGAWTATEEAWRFTPDGDNLSVVFEWLQDGVFLTNDTDITVCPTEETVLTARATYSACTGEEIVKENNFTIHVGQEIEANEPQDLSACSNGEDVTFDLTESLEGIMTDPTGYNFTFYASQEAAELGLDDNLPEMYTTNTPQTIYIRITEGNIDCPIFRSFDLTLTNIPPVFTVTDDVTVCEGTEVTLEVFAGNFDPNSPDVEYSWSLDGNDLGLTTQSITVTEGGVYDVTVNNAGCVGNAEIVVTTITAPEVDELSNVTVCDSYTLEPLTVGNYYTGTGGTGTMLSAGETISSTQTIYIYATNSNCSDESSFTVTVNDTPTIVNPGNQASCDQYILPALAVGNYYTAAGGTGTMLSEGDAVTSSQTIFIYAESGTTPNCTAEESFEVTIVSSPVAQVLAPVTACDSYVLQALDPDNNYYTGPGGTGTMLSAGDTITESQTLYIFAQTNPVTECTDESEFVVTVVSPQFNLGGPYIACVATNITISVEDPNFDTANATFAWTYNGAPMAATGSSVQAIGFGTYEVTVTVNGCSRTESVNATEDVNAVAVMFEEGCEGPDYMITVMDIEGSFNPDTASYTWTGPNGFSETTQTVTVPGAGLYTVTVVTEDGCIGGTEINVLDTSCSIPRGISPNNDTMNDNFDLTSLDVRKISIFNRYGKEVFSYGAYTNQWHGQTNDGQELPTGTYFYSIERSNGESKTGWVYINREE